MKKVAFKTDVNYKDALKSKGHAPKRKRTSKYDVIPVGSYISTTKKNHTNIYATLWVYGKNIGKKFSSVTDVSGVSRIFRTV